MNTIKYKSDCYYIEHSAKKEKHQTTEVLHQKMLGERSYSEGTSTLLHYKPPLGPPGAPSNEKKKKVSIRKKINSVKSFFSDKNKFRGGNLSRNASMPDIYAAMETNNDSDSLHNGYGGNNRPQVKLRNKSSRHGAKLSLRPRSECLEFIDENQGLSPTMPWMRRHMLTDSSPGSTISCRSEYAFRSPLMFDEREEYMSQSSLKMADSFDSLLSDGGFSSLDENHNEAPLFPKFPTSVPDDDQEKVMNKNENKKKEKNKKLKKKDRKLSLNQKETKDAESELERNLYVRKSKSFQHQKKRELFANQTKHYSAEAEDDQHRNKNLPSLEHNDLRTLMELEATRVLDGRCYDPKVAAKWSKEISGSIRERLRHHTSRNYKIVVNTFIGTVGLTEEHVHVACQSVTDPVDDRFIMTALKTDELFVAITLLLLKY